MAKYKCKMCGAPLDVNEGQTVITCEFCQSKQTVANADDERKEELFNRANSLRANCEFDKAILSYQSILSLFPTEPEAYWGICLSKYGIEYVNDPISNKKIPTIHRASFNSILKDSDYISALSYADAIAKEEYQEEAQVIDNIQKNILSISQKEQPFDIFICYKETAANGKRTHDSVLAQEIYSNLVDKGYKVFFSRITLESKLGSMYEPYIFAALNSAKIMLCIGTKKEYFEAIWVKNEWSRFIDMMATRPDRYLIPCYKGMEAYDMPEQFLAFQGQDMSKLGFMQDLLRGIDKIMGRNEAPKEQIKTQIIQTDVNISALLKRTEILLSDGNFEKADELLERILDNDPTNSQAYLFKLLIELQFNTVEELKTLDYTLEEENNFKKAYDFGDDTQKNKLDAINEFINKKNEEVRLGKLYDIAMDYKNSGKYAEAEASFSELAGFRDSTQQALECVNLGKEDIYNNALSHKEDGDYTRAIELFEKIKDFRDSEYQITDCNNLFIQNKYERAIELKEEGLFDKASDIFMEILSYQDSDFQVDECARLKTEAKKESVYNSCIFDHEINPYFDSAALKLACEKLATIPNYKDSNQLLVKYEGILKDFKLELDRKNEEDRRLRAIKKKKIKLISIITSVTSLILTTVLLLTFLFFIPNGRQNDIRSLIDSGDYNGALRLINENGNFGDSENLRDMCYAGKAFESLDYETGIDHIYKIGGSVNVKYDANGGTAEKENETIQGLSSHINNSINKNGYTFHGWLLTDYSLDAKNHAASINLKASYEIITYKINYILNGGDAILPQSYNTEESIKIPNPTKVGHTFLGWTGNGLTKPTKDFVIKTGSIGNKLYRANWKANDYVIYLDTNGGSLTENEVKVTFDSTFELPIPTNNGYIFDGWYDINSNKIENGIYKIDDDLRLKAKWTPIDYSITYNLNGGTNADINPSTYNVESSEIIISDPNKDGYTFLGWTTDTITTPTKNLKISQGSTGDMTFNANWKANTYTVTIDLNGGVCDKTSFDVTFDQYYSLIIPSRVGYTFDKFTYSDANLEFANSGIYTINSNLTVLCNWIANTNTTYVVNHYTQNLTNNDFTKVDTNNLTGTSDDIISIDANTYEGFTPERSFENVTISPDGSTVVDFYYTRNTYTISFASNGGSNIADKVYKYEETIPLDVKPMREGYTFDGWYSDINQTTLFDKMPASDLTVYAYYKEELKASNFDYEFNLEEVTITKGHNLTGSVVVPKYIGGKLVKIISHFAFANLNTITDITLSSEVNELGSFAFSGCTSLTLINGTSNISIIYDSTFEGCVNLSTFPDLSNVTSIGNSAFEGCSSLTTITVGNVLTSIGNRAFADCSMLLETPNLSNINYLGSYAFSGCELLTDIKSLNGSSYFGDGVFSGCKNITKIAISFKNNVDSLMLASLFEYKTDDVSYYSVSTPRGMTLYVPKKLTQIEFDTLGKTPDYFLYGLTSITKVTDNSLSTSFIGFHSFDGCNNLVDYTVANPISVTVYDYAFNNCSSLTTLPNFDLVQVCNYGFANCSSLLVLPTMDNISYIGDYAFSGCNLITTIKAPFASHMGIGALNGCYSLTELEIPFVGTDSASTEAFGVIFGTTQYNNSYPATQFNETYYIPNGLTKLTIGGSLINDYSCENLISVTNLVVNNTVSSIGEGAFKGLNLLESITLPFVGKSELATAEESVFGYIFGHEYFVERNYGQRIDEYLFKYGEFLNMKYSNKNNMIWGYTTEPYNILSHYYFIPTTIKNVNITLSTKIPDAAFNGCYMIEKVTIPENTTSIGVAAFQDCTSLKQFNSNNDGLFNIPNSVINIGDYSFYNNLLVSSIILGDGITNIGNYSFAECVMVDKFNSTLLNSLSTPQSCQSIGKYAFKNMSLITSIIVNDNVKSIGEGAFYNFNLLEDITLPFIGQSNDATHYNSVFGYIFGYTSSAEYRYASIYDFPIYGNFVNVKYSNKNNAIWSYTTADLTTEKEEHLFSIYYYYIPISLKKVTITTSTKIPSAAFNGCSMIEKITIPENTTTIGAAAFQDCTSLKQFNSNTDGLFNIPNDVINIGDYAFSSNVLASNIILGNNINMIGSYAFAECVSVNKVNSNNLYNISIPQSCQHIGDYAFKNMSLITNIVVNDNLVSIGEGAFAGINSLESISLPFIGKSDISTGYSSVFGYIFGYSIGSSDSIHGGELDYQPSDEFVNVKYSNPNYGEVIKGFWGYTQLSGVNWYNHWYHSYYYHIPASLKTVTITVDNTIPIAAFNGCATIKNIHLINCIDAIGDYAFQNCSAQVDYLIEPLISGAWDGKTVADKYNGGSGTEIDPYQIFSAKEFVYFLNQVRNGVNYENTYFKLTSDINLGNHDINPTALTAITSFKGILNGAGRKIYNVNLVFKDNNYYHGLFGFVDGTIKNIGFENINSNETITSKDDIYIGGIVGKLNGTLENVYVKSELFTTSSHNSYCGGMVGYNNGKIINSYTDVDINCKSINLKAYAGGLVGYNAGMIEGSFAYGNVNAHGYVESLTYASGLVGDVSVTSSITNCFRFDGQVITCFGNVSNSFNQIGKLSTIDDINNYCKLNWDSKVWSFKKVLPAFSKQ